MRALKSVRARLVSYLPHARHAFSSAIEAFFYPALTILSAPILVRQLGQAQYGLLAFVYALAGLGLIASVGVGTATIKHVSERNGTNDRDGAAAVVRASLALTLLGCAIFGGLILALSQWLSTTVLARVGAPEQVREAMVLAVAFVILQQTDSVYASALRGLERFGASATAEVISRSLAFAALVTVALVWGSVFRALVAQLVFAAFGVVLKAVLCGRMLGRQIPLPSWTQPSIAAVFRFSKWSWFQGFAGALFNAGDRLILGALLGAVALGQYSLCLQMAQLVHAIPAALMAGLFPAVSRLRALDPSFAIARVRGRSILVNVVVALTLAASLVLLARPITTLWLGPSSVEVASYLVTLTLAFLVLSVNVAPHLLLLAVGEIRFIALSNTLGGLAMIVGIVLLVPRFGIHGAALARVAYGLVVSTNYWKLYERR